MKISEQLKAAKSLIDEPHKWTQGVPARNIYNKNVPFDSENACRFCSVGAIWRLNTTMKELTRYNSSPLTSYLNFVSWKEGIAAFNDNNNHAEVMKVWDKAIELAESEGN